jgi:hypothetical protein
LNRNRLENIVHSHDWFRCSPPASPDQPSWTTAGSRRQGDCNKASNAKFLSLRLNLQKKKTSRKAHLLLESSAATSLQVPPLRCTFSLEVPHHPSRKDGAKQISNIHTKETRVLPEGFSFCLPSCCSPPTLRQGPLLEPASSHFSN